MSSEKKIAANRRNAKKSKGPKTKRGKYHSSFNAVLDALFSPRILRTEDPKPIEKLWEELCSQEQPVGVLETMRLQLVLSDIVRLARLENAELSHTYYSIEVANSERREREEEEEQERQEEFETEMWLEGKTLEQTESDSPDESDSEQQESEEEIDDEPTAEDVEKGVCQSMYDAAPIDERREKIHRSLDRNLKAFFELQQRRTRKIDQAVVGDRKNIKNS